LIRLAESADFLLLSVDKQVQSSGDILKAQVVRD
jgi:hypothetical protein